MPMEVNRAWGGENHAVAEVLIVGAGLAGAIAARTLAEAGVEVVCLEQGERTNPADYPGGQPEWELVSRTRWSPDPNARRNAGDYPLEVSDSDVLPLMFNGVGGSTILYGAQWPRLRPSDFRVRQMDGVADDWPLSWKELWPYYDQVDDEMGISGLEGDPAYPAMRVPPLPPLPIGPGGERLARGLDKLGWHWWPAPNAIASRPYQGRRPCVQRGTCLSGCGEGAKASTDRTHWPVAEQLGARLMTGVRVREITISPEGLANGAVYVDPTGLEHHQAAQVVLLAGNAIGTARLLLMSLSPRFPDGLANGSGLVGRRLMLHARARVVAFFEDDFASWRGQFGQGVHSYQFYESDPSRGFVRGAKWYSMPTGGPLGAALAARPAEQVWGEALHTQVARTVGHTVAWGILGEDLPDEGNRIELDPVLKDGAGLPAPRVTYRISENSHRMMDFHVERAVESCRAAGAYDVKVDRTNAGASAHLMGTCRMGTDPRSSVVDAWCRSHEVPNLYVIDSSTFVTSGGVNPGPTVAALAKRATAHLIETRQAQRVP